MCPKVSVKPKRAREGVTLSVHLDITKHVSCGEGHKDIVHALNSGPGNAQFFFFPYEVTVTVSSFYAISA